MHQYVSDYKMVPSGENNCPPQEILLSHQDPAYQTMPSCAAMLRSRILVADLQILGSAFFFGVGFLGQREVSVNGLGPMTCNALRFALSTLFLTMVAPIIPKGFFDESDQKEEKADSDVEHEGSSGFDDDSETETDGLLGKTLPMGNKTSSSTLNIAGSESICYNRETGGENSGRRSGSGPDTNSIVLNRLLGPMFGPLGSMKRMPAYWGITLGIINFAASGFQQWGISKTSASKCAFIAGFDLFLTPIFSLFMPSFKSNAKPQLSTWIAVGISLIGVYLLSGSSIDEFELGAGETLTLISTLFWTFHIVYTDIATGYVDMIEMMEIQFAVVTFLSGITAFLFEIDYLSVSQLILFLPWLLFLSISEGLGFFLMAVGQSFSPPTHAAIILSLEGVFASIASFFFLGEVLTSRDLTGCALMLAATVVAKVGCCGLDRKRRGKGGDFSMIELGEVVSNEGVMRTRSKDSSELRRATPEQDKSQSMFFVSTCKD